MQESNSFAADEQKIVEHHKLRFFNPNQNFNTTYNENYYDRDSVMEFIDKQMGITKEKLQVHLNFLDIYRIVKQNDY